LFSDGTLQEAKEQALRSLFHSLGLPAGSLSSFLITSFVYFSLPLDSALLARIRRQLGRLASPAAAQGAAAAFDKGVRLSDETLSESALAIDPGGSSGRQGPSGEQGPSGGQGPAEKRKSLAGAALAAELAALSGEIDPRWTLLNRLPGKSGKFWMVFPLNCSLDGVDFDITLRLLLENQTGFPLKAARLAADIITATSRRLFVLDKPGQGGEARLYLSPLPSGTEQARIKQDLYQALSPLVCGVRVLEADTFILDGEGGLPLPVDEEA
jgi:hypothetical protein